MGDTLSQEELDALLGNIMTDSNDEDGANKAASATAEGDARFEGYLTSEQKDVLGEAGNISMGTSATTLYQLLGQKVYITTPRVTVLDLPTLAARFDRPCVGVRVSYTSGLIGSNVLILKQHDVKIITSFMMGKDGEVEDADEPVNELDLSAIAEAMNQMIGTSSTSLSSLVNLTIDIDTPVAFPMDKEDNTFFDNIEFDEEILVAVTFRMEVGTLIDSEITQLLPLQFAKRMVETMKNEMMGSVPAPPLAATPAPAPAPAPQAPPPVQEMPPQYAAYPPQMPPPTYSQPHVNAQPVQFANFAANLPDGHRENIGLIMDVPLEVTVELGRTTKKIKEILEFSPGSTIIELNKLAGEPIDVLVNGKFIAKGEVVVIDENFAVRITDIVSVDKRI